MPDRSDVVVVSVRDTDVDEPIVWSPLPHLTLEDSTRRRVRLKDYINPPVGEARFELHPDYTLPSGWRLRDNGNLLYNAILGQTIQLRFNATRGSESGYSDILRITREQAFISRLVPNRLPLGLAFNTTAQRVLLYNATDIGITPVRYFITSFDINGNEQVSESVEISDIEPERAAGIGFDGTYFWICGSDPSGGGDIIKINADGTLNATYTYVGGEIESLAYDGTSMWALDIYNRQLRKFSTSGVEDTTAVVNLPLAADVSDQTGYYTGRAQYGLTYGDGHFWIIQHHIQTRLYIFCTTPAGVAVPSRHVDISDPDFSSAGCTYNPTTRNLWWVIDGTDDGGSRFAELRAQQI
ncbi:hypothetical protein F4Y93_06055 [Candidatus Poribacteria bacterium]|nr:hypothetical protein [Candidatus Poribacteria bacterium]